MECKTPKSPKPTDGKEVPSKRDYGPWPVVGYVGFPKMEAALDKSQQGIRNLVAADLLPAPVQISPNRVGWPVDVARRAIDELPSKIAALKRVTRGAGARNRKVGAAHPEAA